MPCSKLGPPAPPSPKSGAQTLKLLAEPNMLGNILLEVGTPNVHHFHIKRCQLESQLSTTQALLALQARRNMHRRRSKVSL